MNRDEKTTAVNELRERVTRATVTLLATSQGLSVAKMQQLRRAVRRAGGEVKVAKNTLARRALKDTAAAKLESFLQGPTGLVFGYADPVAVTKALVRFAEENDKLSIKGGVLDQELLEPAAVSALAKLPSREVLLGTLLGVIQAPAAQLLRTIQEPGAQLARLLDQVRARLESNA